MKDWKKVKVEIKSIHNEIDPDNIFEFETNGCKVRLFFTVEHNPNIPDTILDQLLLVFERKIKDNEAKAREGIYKQE